MRTRTGTFFYVFLLLVTLHSEAFAQHKWLDSYEPSDVPLTEQDQVDVTQSLVRSVQKGNPKEPELPEAARRDKKQRFLVFTVGDLSSIPLVILVEGDGLPEAFTRAVRELDHRISGAQPNRWVRIDLVTHVRDLNLLGFDRPLLLEPGRDGLAFDPEQRVVMLPDELLARGVISENRKVDKDALTNLLRSRGLDPAQSQLLSGPDGVKKLLAFKTRATISNGSESYVLDRGHRMFERLSKDQVLSAAEAAGQYLLRSLGPDGQFQYRYDAATDTTATDYNILRHAGTVLSLIDLYAVTQKKDLLPPIKSALNWLVGQTQPCGENSEQLCVVENDFVKLGGNALAVLALAKYTRITGDAAFKPQLLKLAGWIRSDLRQDGSFYAHKQRFSSGEIDPFISSYYPGEAIYALTEVFRVDNDPSWIDTAEKAARFLIEVRDGDQPDTKLNHDHWLLYGLNNLYRIRPRNSYLAHTKRLVRVITQSQIVSGSESDWIGGYLRPPRSTPTATRTEGLCVARSLLEKYGAREMVDIAEKAIDAGIRFELQLQITPESGLFLPNYERAKGGIRGSLTDFDVQIDYVQHVLSSYLLDYRILSELAEREVGRK